MHTEHHGSTPHEYTDIVFYDVLAHLFETELSDSILFDIEKYEINQFLKDNNELLLKKKNYGWPMDYRAIEELEEWLMKEQYSYYVISASYGLSGWVLARRMEII